MSRAMDKLYMHPLFYDAMSGEFTPPSDQDNRRHTLGRLAYASFTKGVVTMPHTRMLGVHPHNELLKFAYRPSWADSVEATVSGILTRDCGMFELSDLTLLHENTSLQVRSRTDLENNIPSFELTGLSGATVSGPLELGSSLNLARNLITEEAQKFFDETA